MRYKKIMLMALLLLAVLTIGAASAADGVDAVAADDSGDEAVVEAPVDEVADEQVADDADEQTVESADEDLMEDDDSASDDWYVIPHVIRGAHYDNYDKTLARIFWPSNLDASNKHVEVIYNGTKIDEKNDLERPSSGSFTVTGAANEKQTVLTFGDFGINDPQYTEGNYNYVIKYGSSILLNSSFNVADERYDGSNAGFPNEWFNYFEPESFNFMLFNSEVDIDDGDAVIFSFIFPSRIASLEEQEDYNLEYINSHNVMVFVEDQDLTKDRDEYYADFYFDIYSEGEYGKTKNVTLGDILDEKMVEPGIYKVTVVHDSVIGVVNLKITQDYTDSDFVEISTWDVTEPDDAVCSVSDPTFSGLSGTVTVYVDGNQAYSEKLVAEQYEFVEILLKNLTGTYYNGNHTIKVVYNKDNGLKEFETTSAKPFSAEGVVSFVGISETGNIPATITASGMTISYGQDKYLVATLKDGNGNPISNVDVTISIMGVKYPLTTDENGKVKQALKELPPKKSHSITFTFEDAKYQKATKTVKVTVNKATPKITAKKKVTFKKSVKTKKYKITLKNSKNKVLKNKKVTIKVNKKTYTAKTSSKGVATFKITKLTKKGKYTATIKYGGDKYNAAKSVKVKITVK